MKLGVALWPDRDVRQLADLAAAAEDAGFDALWWPDHYDARECSAVLALCAVRTRRMQLGTAVTSVLLRHPAMLASMFATLSEMSDGRVVAGLGPGGFEVKTDLAVTTASPLTAMREAVAILRGLCAGERVALGDGRVFPVNGARLKFRPPGRIPIYLAARGLRMTELAGEIADGLITHGLARPYLEAVRARVEAGARRARRPATACETMLMLEVAIDDDRDRARNALRGRSVLMVGGEYADDLIPLYGLDPARVAPVRAAVRARDPTAAERIDDEMVDAFAVGGPPGHVAEQLAAVAGLGIDAFIVSPGQAVDRRAIEHLGQALREVFP